MPRKPQVRYFDSRGGYYCQIKKKQHPLAKGPKDEPDGPTYKAAMEAYFRLQEMDNLPEAGTTARVRTVLDAYMQSRERKVRASTFSSKLRMLKLFADRYGNEPVWAVKPLMIEEFIGEMRKGRMVETRSGRQLMRWKTGNTEALFIRHLSAAFRWAVKQQIIPFNPMDAVERPDTTTRARERILTAEEKKAVREELKLNRQRCLRNIIVALEDTGARPGELAAAKVSDFNPDLGAIVYLADDKRKAGEFAHKNSKRKDRVVYFTGATLEMVRDLVSGKKPGDLIFPSQAGKQYDTFTLTACFRCLRKRLNLPHLVAYSYRHTFATEWLMDGGSIDNLAELLGNSPEIIRKHYSHLCRQHDFLRARLEAFKARNTSGPSV